MDEVFFQSDSRAELPQLFMAQVYEAPSSKNSAMLLLPGTESVPCSKRFKRVQTGQALSKGDYVLVGRVSGTYVIIGKIIT